jgi:methylenetetrahydrofolate dehydrogenase (NADP+)/methenyltetrahydrofolate cyclohydrolase
MEIIDGRGIARKILADLKVQVAALRFVPVFCDVLVGNNKPSAQYVNMKAKTAELIGIKFRRAEYAADILVQDLIGEIKSISLEPNMCGLIVQLPLPAGLPRQDILDAIAPKVDVDCMGYKNLEDFYKGKARFTPPTAAAIMAILDALLLDLSSKQILVVGQGELVGRPVTFLLKQKGLNVNIADINTKNTDELLKSADVIISATGKAGLITGKKIKNGAVIIDAGTSESKGGIVGDVNFESIKNVAGAISPVPGGVGPVTVAQLLTNVVLAAKNI